MPDPKNLAKKELFGSTIEKTREYTEGVKKYSKNLQKNKKSVEDGNGINIQGNKATAKPYEKKFVPSKNRGNSSALIVGKDGKSFGDSESSLTPNERKNSEGGKAGREKALYRRYQSDSTSTMNARQKNADFYNLNSGANPEPNQAGKETLVRMGKAKLSGEAYQNAKKFAGK